MLYRIRKLTKKPKLRDRQVIVCACSECGLTIPLKRVLRAPNPFDANEELQGCPHCKSIDSMVRVCEIEGCTHDATHGIPLKSGRYVQCCLPHLEALDALDREERREPDC